MPSAVDPPKGGVFHTRCPRRFGVQCDTEEPALIEVAPGHGIRCHLAATPEVLAGLARRQRLRPAGAAAPRTVLLSGRVQHPAPRAAEACAVLRAGTRLLVLALRFEGGEAGWVCTALDAGFTPERRRALAGATSGASAAG